MECQWGSEGGERRLEIPPPLHHDESVSLSRRRILSTTTATTAQVESLCHSHLDQELDDSEAGGVAWGSGRHHHNDTRHPKGGVDVEGEAHC